MDGFGRWGWGGVEHLGVGLYLYIHGTRRISIEDHPFVPSLELAPTPTPVR
jgi:hypothetical protein